MATGQGEQARSARRRRLRALDSEIFALALPTFATLVTEPLLLIADSAFIGHLGTDQLAGLGIASNVIGIVVGLCVFLAYGTTSTVARRLGAGDRQAARFLKPLQRGGHALPRLAVEHPRRETEMVEDHLHV